MEPLLIGVLSSVIASTLMLFIEPRVSPKKKKAEQTYPQTAQSNQPHPPSAQPVALAAALPAWVSWVLVIFLPPLAVYLQKGARPAVWINIGLTLLGRWPGIFHALFIVVLKQLRFS